MEFICYILIHMYLPKVSKVTFISVHLVNYHKIINVVTQCDILWNIKMITICEPCYWETAKKLMSHRGVTAELFSWSYQGKVNHLWWSLVTSVEKGAFGKSILAYPGLLFALIKIVIRKSSYRYSHHLITFLTIQSHF